MSSNTPEIQIRKVFDKFNSLEGDVDTKKKALCFFIMNELELENSVEMKDIVTYRLRTTYFSTYNKLFSKLGKNKKNSIDFAAAYSGWLDGTLKIKERAEKTPKNSGVKGKKKIKFVYLLCCISNYPGLPELFYFFDSFG